jgi:hypothetical protein
MIMRDAVNDASLGLLLAWSVSESLFKHGKVYEASLIGLCTWNTVTCIVELRHLLFLHVERFGTCYGA